MVGLTRESINKHLAAWQLAGILKIGHATIDILNVDALRERSE